MTSRIDFLFSIAFALEFYFDESVKWAAQRINHGIKYSQMTDLFHEYFQRKFKQMKAFL